jgi:type III restriction enzyme
MENYWIPGVNNLLSHGRWAFAELRDIYTLEVDLDAAIRTELEKILAQNQAEAAK